MRNFQNRRFACDSQQLRAALNIKIANSLVLSNILICHQEPFKAHFRSPWCLESSCFNQGIEISFLCFCYKDTELLRCCVEIETDTGTYNLFSFSVPLYSKRKNCTIQIVYYSSHFDKNVPQRRLGARNVVLVPNKQLSLQIRELYTFQRPV